MFKRQAPCLAKSSAVSSAKAFDARVISTLPAAIGIDKMRFRSFRGSRAIPLSPCSWLKRALSQASASLSEITWSSLWYCSRTWLTIQSWSMPTGALVRLKASWTFAEMDLTTHSRSASKSLTLIMGPVGMIGIVACRRDFACG